MPPDELQFLSEAAKLDWKDYDMTKGRKVPGKAASVNQFGLPRYIPEEIRRIVRQACGFGCVICGTFMTDQEHIIPTFADATEHNPDHMCLLCALCHDQVTRGWLSKETVQEARQSPACLKEGYSHNKFHIGDRFPMVELGPLLCINTPVLISIMGEDILRIEPPDTTGHPYQISGKFYDQDGRETLIIKKNRCSVNSSNWDVNIEGNKLTIRSAPRRIVLQIIVQPPDRLQICRLDLNHKGGFVKAYQDKIFVWNSQNHFMILGASQMEHSNKIISVTKYGIMAGIGAGVTQGIDGKSVRAILGPYSAIGVSNEKTYIIQQIKEGQKKVREQVSEAKMRKHYREMEEQDRRMEELQQQWEAYMKHKSE
jgi:hypothetical protein